MATTFTPKELAAKLDTDARTVRKFLRSDAGLNDRVGKGHRWAIEARQVRSLTTRFNKWDADRKAAAEATDEVEATEGD